jgi:endosialidase-like protein
MLTAYLANRRKLFFVSLLILLASAGAALAQGPGTTFTFQGKLGDSGSPINGAFDMQFKLFDGTDQASSNQIGTTVTLNNPLVQVTNSVFTVQLDFGSAALSGADRFLQIGIRQNSSASYTVLSPRTKITSAPYSIRSLNSAGADSLSRACRGCVQDIQIDSVSATKLTGALPLSSIPANSDNYIQNTSTPQTNSNFSISGTGTANILSAMQFNLGGGRALTEPGIGNLFVGGGAGESNTGTNNSFFGRGAGETNTTGSENSFFGLDAGRFSNGFANSFFGRSAGQNNRGSGNSFFGNTAGFQNDTGTENSFFGGGAGFNNTSGGNNAFFGHLAGEANTTASFNSFFGDSAGKSNTTGGGNSFFGGEAGQLNTTGESNSFFGTQSGFRNTTGAQNSFVGNKAGSNNSTGHSNSFFGALAGTLNTTASFNSFFGNQAGQENTTGQTNSFFGSVAGLSNVTGSGNSFFGFSAGYANTTGNNNSFFGNGAGNANKTSDNSFFGNQAGAINTTGGSNSFFGSQAGFSNTTASGNSFFGKSAGNANATGLDNSFFGSGAGSAINGNSNSFFGVNAGGLVQSGNDNTFIGTGADFESLGGTGSRNTLIGAGTRATSGLLNATAIGASASVTQSNSLVLGSPVVNVGIGTTAPKSALHIGVNGGQILLGDAGCNAGFTGIGFGASLSGCSNFSLLGNGTDTIINHPTGGAIAFRENNVTQFSIASGGLVSIGTLGTGGTATLCRNASGQFSTCAELVGEGPNTIVRSITGGVILKSVAGSLTLEPTGLVRVGLLQGGGTTTLCTDGSNHLALCSSSRRYKTNINPFNSGLSLIKSLNPVSFKWKTNNSSDFGLVAEDVAAVEPLLVTHNDKGQIEGVKYDRVGVVLINAVKEQQAQIEAQQKQISEQRQMITAQQEERYCQVNGRRCNQAIHSA